MKATPERIQAHRPGLLLGALTLVYLLLELAFNARLLEAAGSAASGDRLQVIEVEGRVLSSIGCVLLIWRFAVAVMNRYRARQKAQGSTLLMRLFMLALLSLTVGPAVYWGQRALIDQVVDRSDAQDRHRAVRSLLVGQAMGAGVLSIRDLPFDNAALQSPEGMTLMSIMPLLAFTSRTMPESVGARMVEIVDAMSRSGRTSAEHVYNEHYLPAVREVRRRYESDYVDASQKMDQAPDTTGAALEAWHEYLKTVNRLPFTADSATPAQRQHVIAQVRARGIEVPDNWRLDDKPTFMNSPPFASAELQFRRKADQILGQGSTIPPGLDWSAFTAHRDVQRFVARELVQRWPDFGGRKTGALPLDGGFDQFRAAVFEPQIKQAVQARLKELSAPARAFANGGTLEGAGKQALRAMLVPPIALSLSLFFGLLNFMALLLTPFAHSRLARTAMGALCLGALALTPLLLDNRITTAKAYRNLHDVMESNHQGAAQTLDWLVRVQPVMYPVGHALSPLLEAASATVRGRRTLL